MVEGGQRWLPPPMLAVEAVKSKDGCAGMGGQRRGAAAGPVCAERKRAQAGNSFRPPPIAFKIQTGRDRTLSELERDRWEDILRGLTAERSAVKAGMVFALDHAEAATEVVEVLQVRRCRRPAVAAPGN